MTVTLWRRTPTRVIAGTLALLALAYYVVVPRVLAQRSSALVVVETTRGTFAFDTYPKDAPLSVAHILKLAKAGFYDGQRVHRDVCGQNVQ